VGFEKIDLEAVGSGIAGFETAGLVGSAANLDSSVLRQATER
jgi:hypothetical protein